MSYFACQHSCQSNIDCGEELVNPFDKYFPAAFLHRAFFEVMPASHWCSEYYDKSCSEDHGKEPCWHPKHCSWIKLPPFPIFAVISPVGSVVLIPLFILCHESFLFGHAPFEHQDSNYRLDAEVYLYPHWDNIKHI
mgnify:CR=1 FL=1